MGLFGFFKIKRSAVTQSGPATEPNDIANYDKALSELLAAPVGGKVPVTVDSALGLATVWACIRILSESVGILPIHLYRRGKNGREKVVSHPSLSALREPNEYWNRFDLLQWLMSGALATGNGYARIYRDEFYSPVSFGYLKPCDVTPFIDDNTGRLYYNVNGEILEPYDILHIKGLGTDPIKGKSPIAVHKIGRASCRERVYACV